MSTRLLMVDDDPAFRRLCGIALDQEGIEFVGVGTSREALKELENAPRSFDLVLLDMELPGMKGWELLKVLRDRGQDIPVVLISVLDSVEEKVRSLDLGADDYIVKPCSFEELLSRLHAVLRRVQRRAVINVGDLQIDPVLRRVQWQDRQIDLTPREFEVLQVLVKEAGHVVSTAYFLEKVWKLDGEPTANSLQVHVSRLKRKLKHSTASVRIETIVGHGYRLIDATASAEAKR